MRSRWAIKSHSILIAAFTLTLGACQGMHNVEPEIKADVPLAFSGNNTDLLQKGSIAEQGYKSFFVDENLLQVIDLALANNRDLRTAILNIQRAKHQYKISQNNQLPTIGANTGILRQDSINTEKVDTSYNVDLGITAYELDFWGRIASLKDNALNTYLASQSAREAIQVSLISEVSKAWLSYSFFKSNLLLSEQTLKAQLDAYHLNKKRFDVGVDNEVPLHQAQISVETARSDVANFKTQLAQSENLLNLLLGQPIPHDLLPQQKVLKITNLALSSTGLPSDLLNNRPDIKEAEFKLNAAGANIGAAKAKLFPTISLTGKAGYASSDLSGLFRSNNFVWSFGPNLDIPIFDWGTRKSNVKISEIDQQLSLAEYEKSIQTAFREVNDVLATRQFIEDRLSSQNQLVKATKMTYKLSNARFKAGIDSFLPVLDSQRASYAAEQSLLALEQINLNNQIELYKVLGGGKTL